MALAEKLRIVVVEDDEALAQAIKRQLEFIDMSAIIFHLYQDALDFFQRRPGSSVHLLLLDLNLPDGNGLLLFQWLQQKGFALPTIFVTGETDERTKIRSLDMGGDDYLIKPFGFAEMLSRVNAVLRRTSIPQGGRMNSIIPASEKEFYFCGVKVLPATMEICFPSGAIRVGKKELNILFYMSQNPHQMLRRERIMNDLWGKFINPKSRSLDQYIMKIRKLFQEHNISLACLETVHSLGYCYKPDITYKTI
ncbi:MAG: response regulator transcription factor [Puniceicoccales bacterium]|jgi:two-component system alkaline phosphatase synthesis response regulator PhoP|nr:response regulator transcription factor [Puniceicoccales bacterium]